MTGSYPDKFYPSDLEIIIHMSEQPAHSGFTRYLTFEAHNGRRKRLKIKFEKEGPLQWKGTFPEELEVLRTLVDTGNRNYWDRMFLENRGGRTTLPIDRIQIIVRYIVTIRLPRFIKEKKNDVVKAVLPIVDWQIKMNLLAGYDSICLDEFARRTRYALAGIEENDPPVIRMVAADLGKSGSDGEKKDQYGKNPKYRDAPPGRQLCSEFVSWYYYEANIKVNGNSQRNTLRDVKGTQDLHDLFKAERALYRYNNSTSKQAFVHTRTNERYIPQPGDFLERRKDGKAKHSMIMYRWLPGDPSASGHGRYNTAIVFNGPWPVTLRLVRIHEDEKNKDVDFWLGKID